MSKVMRALGLMSGTSLDGIDVALLTTDGETLVERGPAMTFPYGEPMRTLLRSAIGDAAALQSRHERPGALPHAERELTEHHSAAVSHFIRKHAIARETIDVIGFHGQTVLHRAEQRTSKTISSPKAILDPPKIDVETAEATLTVQLGLGEMLAEYTRIPVVYDLRANDTSRGGHGAPLVPVYHRALAAKIPQRPLCVVNIGGVANVTWIGRNGDLVAFDTGPGNALLDDWLKVKTGQAYDEGGALAGRGQVKEMIVSKYLSAPFFHAPGPKSLDRNAFSLDLLEGLSAEDGAATLTDFTARAIAMSRVLVPEPPELWIVCGGGRRNNTLMGMIAGLVEEAVVPAEAVGFDGDSIEAEAWAYMAVRCLKGLPITFPGTTGVSTPMTGGILASPKSRYLS